MVAASPTAQDRRDVNEALLILTPTVALVAELACEVLGPAWLDEINRRHRAAGRSEIEALDERAALALLGSESEFRDMIGPEWQARARQLNAIFNTAMHNNQRGTWRDGDAQRAWRLSSEIKTFLERRAGPVPPHAPQHHDRPYHPAPEPLRQISTLDVLVSKPEEAGDAPVAGRPRARRLARRDRARATFGQSPSSWAWVSLTLGLMGCFMFPFAPLALIRGGACAARVGGPRGRRGGCGGVGHGGRASGGVVGRGVVRVEGRVSCGPRDDDSGGRWRAFVAGGFAGRAAVTRLDRADGVFGTLTLNSASRVNQPERFKHCALPSLLVHNSAGSGHSWPAELRATRARRRDRGLSASQRAGCRALPGRPTA